MSKGICCINLINDISTDYENGEIKIKIFDKYKDIMLNEDIMWSLIDYLNSKTDFRYIFEYIKKNGELDFTNIKTYQKIDETTDNAIIDFLKNERFGGKENGK